MVCKSSPYTHNLYILAQGKDITIKWGMTRSLTWKSQHHCDMVAGSIGPEGRRPQVSIPALPQLIMSVFRDESIFPEAWEILKNN